ncbi:hypothetical protein VaNZ11_001894, partial [Volvox africanus]
MDDDDWDVDIDVDALVEQHRQRDAAAAAGSSGARTCATFGNPEFHSGTSTGAQQQQQQQQQQGSAAVKAQQIRDRWAKPKAHRSGLDLHGTGHIVKDADGSMHLHQQGRGWQPPASAAVNAVSGTGAPIFPRQQQQPSWQAVRPQGTAASIVHISQQQHHQQQQQLWDSLPQQASAQAYGPSGWQTAPTYSYPTGLQQQQQQAGGSWPLGGSGSGPGTRSWPYQPLAAAAPYQAAPDGAPQCAAGAPPSGAPPPQPDPSSCVGFRPPYQHT